MITAAHCLKGDNKIPQRDDPKCRYYVTGGILRRSDALFGCVAENKYKVHEYFQRESNRHDDDEECIFGKNGANNHDIAILKFNGLRLPDWVKPAYIPASTSGECLLNYEVINRRSSTFRSSSRNLRRQISGWGQTSNRT